MSRVGAMLCRARTSAPPERVSAAIATRRRIQRVTSVVLRERFLEMEERA